MLRCRCFNNTLLYDTMVVVVVVDVVVVVAGDALKSSSELRSDSENPFFHRGKLAREHIHRPPDLQHRAHIVMATSPELAADEEGHCRKAFSAWKAGEALTQGGKC